MSTPPTTSTKGYTPHCRAKTPKIGWAVWVLVIVALVLLFLPKGCKSSKSQQPQTILGPLKVEEITVKLDSLKQQVIVPTNGRKVTIKWVNPKVEGDSLVDWRTHGPYGMDGGNILSGGWVKPPREHPEISDDKRVFFWSFILEEGGPVELIVKIHYRELIVVQPTP